jgi:ribosomal protein S18 acetylase RimI-like enzyme
MYVLPRYWGTGTGASLWSTAQRRLIEGGSKRVTLWVFADNTRAIRFYEGVGLKAQPASEREINIGGKMLKEVRYAMELAGADRA